MAIALIERYRPRHVLIEDAMTGSALADEVKCKFPSVVARTKPEGDKQVRLFVQSAKFEQGRVWFPKDLLGEEGFLAEFNGREVQARCVVMATGLIDERPPVQGLTDPVAGGAIRFCPICDGYEAMDKRIGVLGTMQAGGKKALFLRTYSPHVSLFSTDDSDFECVLRTQLTVAGIKLARNPLRVEQRNEHIAVFCAGGESHDLDVLYPALGCNARSELATNLGAKCTEIGTLEVDAHQQTTVEGIYAVGDVVTDLHQLTVATGHAAVAATNIHNRLPANFRS